MIKLTCNIVDAIVALRQEFLKDKKNDIYIEGNSGNLNYHKYASIIAKHIYRNDVKCNAFFDDKKDILYEHVKLTAKDLFKELKKLTALELVDDSNIVHLKCNNRTGYGAIISNFNIVASSTIVKYNSEIKFLYKSKLYIGKCIFSDNILGISIIESNTKLLVKCALYDESVLESKDFNILYPTYSYNKDSVVKVFPRIDNIYGKYITSKERAGIFIGKNSKIFGIITNTLSDKSYVLPISIFINKDFKKMQSLNLEFNIKMPYVDDVFLYGLKLDRWYLKKDDEYTAISKITLNNKQIPDLEYMYWELLMNPNAHINII